VWRAPRSPKPAPRGGGAPPTGEAPRPTTQGVYGADGLPSGSASPQSSLGGPSSQRSPGACFGLYKILFHFEALLHNNANTPFIVQYIAQYFTSYCTPPPDFEVFFRCLEVFFVSFSGRILDGWRCLKRKQGALLHIIDNNYCAIPPSPNLYIHTYTYPLPAPLYCLQYCAVYFPHDPLYYNKILAISCKGQGVGLTRRLPGIGRYLLGSSHHPGMYLCGPLRRRWPATGRL